MTNINIYDDKLTPSAKEALKETMIELHDQLLAEANSIAQHGQAANKEISLRDILAAKDRLFKAKMERDKAIYRRRRLIPLIYLSGALYSLIGIFIYLYQNQRFDLEKNLGLIMVFLGVTIILFGFTYKQLLYRRYEETNKNIALSFKDINSDFDVIKRWQVIEKLGSNLMRKNGYSSNESKSINDILKFISGKLKSESLSLEMRELLAIRNKILHEGYELGRQEKQSTLDKADTIIGLLEKLEKV